MLDISSEIRLDSRIQAGQNSENTNDRAYPLLAFRLLIPLCSLLLFSQAGPMTAAGSGNKI